MPKMMFISCGDNVSSLFGKVGFLNTDNSTTYFKGDKLAIYTKFLINQVIVFNQLKSGI